MSLIDKHFPTGAEYAHSTDIFRDFDRIVNEMERPMKRGRSECLILVRASRANESCEYVGIDGMSCRE